MKLHDLKQTAAADVYRERLRVGRIERTRQGSVFTYDPGFLDTVGSEEGIAFQLPYRTRRFETTGVNLHSYFAGLLPEGIRIRTLTQRLKTSEDDLLTLLIAIGNDCIGDIAVTALGEPLSEAIAQVEVKKTKDVLFRELFEKSLRYSDATASESNIPGVQEKVSASTVSFPVRASQGRREYILKLNPQDKPRLVENEEFFLRMAKACGLAVAQASLVYDQGGNAGLLVERFDRVADKQGSIRKWHQEDACQFLDRYPADKYRIHCGEIGEAVVQWSSAPLIEVAKLLRLIAFSYLIGNGDLHAKNISLHADPNSGRVSLTPGYDLLSTLPYGDRKMALKLDGRDDNLRGAAFVAFGERFGVNEKVTKAMLEELCETALDWSKEVGAIGLGDKETKDIQTVMAKRLRDLGVRH